MAKIDDSVKKKVPELRFKGFTDDWEQRKLGDEVRIVMGQSPNSENYTDDPNDYILVQGNADMKNGRVLPRVWTTQVTKQAEKDDLILSVRAPVGDIGKTAYDVVIGRGVAAIKGNEFIFQNLGKMKSDGYWTRYSTGSTFESINSTDIKEAIISVPAIEEQDKIGSFFQQLDETIALHQRKLDLLKEQKKGYLQKMFPKNGAKVPELRFKGFTGDWEERKLGELVEQIIREVPKPNKPYYRMSVRSHAKGTFKQFVDNPENVAMDKLFVVKKDDLVVNITFAWEHAIAVVNEENDGLLVSHRFPTYRADGKSDIEFLHHVVSKENFRRKLEFISPGGAGRNRVLNKKDFLKLKIFVPKIEEQQKIGSFFKQLDNTIALHQRKLDLLKEQKKGFLQKMFV